MNEELSEYNLPKWSRIVVEGVNITEEQAAEILVRTSDFNFYSNDTNWRITIFNILEVPFRENIDVYILIILN